MKSGSAVRKSFVLSRPLEFLPLKKKKNNEGDENIYSIEMLKGGEM